MTTAFASTRRRGHDASADFAVFCIDTVAGRMRETTARYDAATGTFTAPARCP